MSDFCGQGAYNLGIRWVENSHLYHYLNTRPTTQWYNPTLYTTLCTHFFQLFTPTRNAVITDDQGDLYTESTGPITSSQKDISYINTIIAGWQKWSLL